MIIDNTSSEATLSSQGPAFLRVHIVSVEMHQASVKKTGTIWHKNNAGSSLVHATNTVTWLADLTMKQFVKPGAYISKRFLILPYSSKTCPSVAFCWQSHELNECPISHRTFWAIFITTFSFDDFIDDENDDDDVMITLSTFSSLAVVCRI